MLYFPQLTYGAMAQFPVTKRMVERTVVNESADGSRIKLADPAAAMIEWQLQFVGLSDTECAAIETLFQQVEGRLGSFTFLDPFDNLLGWSEDLTAAAWSKDPYLGLTANIADPLGASGAVSVSNGSQAQQSVQQTLTVPAWFQYAVSVYARSGSAAQVTLFASGGGSPLYKAIPIGSAWQRLECAVMPEGTAETVSFGVTLNGGSTVELFGLQVDAQASASKYKKTAAKGGVYPSAFFMDDALTVTTDGLNQNSCTLRIRAVVN